MFVRLKNWLLLLFFQKPVKKEVLATKRPLSILVVSTTGMGDTLFALPSLPFLKKLGSLSFLTHETGKELLKTEKTIDRFFLLPKSLFFSFFSFRKILKKTPFDLIFIFHASQRLVFPLCASLQPKRLIGTLFQNKGLDALFTDLIPWQNSHEVQRRLDQVSLFISPDLPQKGSLVLTREEKKRGEALLLEKNLSLEKPTVFIHPGAQDNYKCWPLENFVSLLSLFRERTTLQLVLLGGKKEREKLLLLQEKALAVFPLLSVRELASLLEKASLFITHDTGPMHLASCLNVPTLALFSPTDPKTYGPYDSPRSKVLFFEKTCLPCLKRACLLPFCMHQISPERVFQTAEKML